MKYKFRIQRLVGILAKVLLISITLFATCVHSKIGAGIGSIKNPESFASENESQVDVDAEKEFDYMDINAKARKAEIIDGLLETYDHRLRPLGKNGSGPVEIQAFVQLRNIENVDDEKMEYTVQMLLRQQWTDTRLKYAHIQNNIEYLQLSDPTKIWIPDVFFSNEKVGSQHKLMQPNIFARIFPNGSILLSNRITLVLSCEMDLSNYPMDSQSCPIMISSYGWASKDMSLVWRSFTPVEIKKGINMPHFELQYFDSTTCPGVGTTGNYSCIQLHLDFARQFAYHIIQVYVPCAMMVVISWVSFWLEPKATEARISLCVTTILTVVTQAYGINTTVPPASYLKAIDVWTFTVQFMVFAAILQYSYVNYLARFQWKRAIKKMNLINTEVREREALRLQEKGERSARRVDTFSKIVFPTFFILFNVAYWSIYLNLSKRVAGSVSEVQYGQDD